MQTKTRTLGKRIAMGISGLALIASLSACGSCSNAWNDVKRSTARRDYQLTLYAADGSKILERDLKNTYVSIGENGSGVRYVENGKMVMLNGTYVLEER